MMVRALAFGAAALLAAEVASAQYVMLTDSTADRIQLLSATDGSVVNANFIVDAGGTPFDFDLPKAAAQVGSEIWVSDQNRDSIFCFTVSLTPTYIRTITGGLDNIRGLNRVGNRVYVSNSDSGNGAPGDAVVVYEMDGTPVTSFPGGADPFDVVGLNGQLIVSEFVSSNPNIVRMNTDGTGLVPFTDSSSSAAVRLPEQLFVGPTGPAGALEVWAAGFQTNVGVFRYDSNGNQLNFYPGGTGNRGVTVLSNGDVLFTDGAGLKKFTPGGSVSTLMSGGGFQYLNPLSLTGPAGADLAVNIGAPASCAADPGGSQVFTVTVMNVGADASAASTLTVTLPPASVATYASATPMPSGVTPTQLTFNLASVAGNFATTSVSVTLTAVQGGATTTLSATVVAAGDTNATNDTGSGSSRITPAAPTVAAAKAIFSSNTALTNSNIAGGHFTTFDTPFVSPNGHWWAIRADTDLATASDSITVRGEVGGTSSVILQEGVTLMGNGAALGIYDPGLDLNDAGVVAFTGDDAAASQDEFVAKTDGTAVTDIAREGQTHAGITLATTASTGNAQVFANGNVAFSSTANPTTNNSYFTDNGTAVTARVGVTAPTGGGGLTVSAIVTGNLTNNGGCQYDATGTHSIYQANIGTVTATDQVIVADGTVVIQEGVTDIDGPGSYTGTPTSAVKIFTMGPTGMWMVRGLNSVATEDWVVRGNGATIAQVYKIGDAIHPGSSLHWADEGTTSFFSMTVDGNGHYVIGGFTDAASDFNDVVYVYDNKVILARENDPVDVDGNGMFDDGMYILSFGNDEVALLEDNTAIFTVSLRDADGALCELNNTSRGEALVSVKIPLGACCNGVLCASTLQVDCAGDPGNFKGVGTACGPSTCGAPANQQCCRGTTCVSVDSGTCTGTVGNSASLVVGSCGPHNQLARCCYADYDHSGTSTIDDLFIYINTWLVASPYTKIDGNTTAAPSIDDLFIFINLWLLGCTP